MSTATNYKPIDCDYYDRLEAWSTTKTVCTIIYRDETGNEQSVTAKIADVYTQEKVEFMKTDSGEIIRLDKLVSVNNVGLPKAK